MEDKEKLFLSAAADLIDIFQVLFKRDNDFYKRSINLVKASFPSLIKEFTLVQAEAERNHKKEAPDFNIFSILRIDRYEVTTHSALISYLLNSSESHGQGRLFLDNFLKLAGVCSNGQKWAIVVEKGGGFDGTINLGRMDIRIINPAGAVVIENKIDTGDQESQLWRYGKWIENNYGIGSLKNKSSFRLIYLAPYIRKPSPISLAPPINKGNKFYIEEGDYEVWSYKKHIRQWLETCLPHVKAPSVHEVLIQYLHLVRSL